MQLSYALIALAAATLANAQLNLPDCAVCLDSYRWPGGLIMPDELTELTWGIAAELLCHRSHQRWLLRSDGLQMSLLQAWASDPDRSLRECCLHARRPIR
jgi:hypothetical protein